MFETQPTAGALSIAQVPAVLAHRAFSPFSKSPPEERAWVLVESGPRLPRRAGRVLAVHAADSAPNAPCSRRTRLPPKFVPRRTFPITGVVSIGQRNTR